MKKTLILMRHAKSSWDSPTLADHDRPLNKRGLASAKALGDRLRELNLSPDEALVSSSIRTQQTFEGLGLSIAPNLSSKLYHSSSDTLLSELENATGNTILIIAHNPGIGEFAERLSHCMRYLPDHPKFYAYPTGATLVVEWEINSWSDIELENGNVRDFIVPRDLL